MIINYRGCVIFVRDGEANDAWRIDHWDKTVKITKGKAVSLADVMPDVDRLISGRNAAILRAKGGHLHEVLEAHHKRIAFGSL